MNFNTKVMDIVKGGTFNVLGRPYFVNDVPAFTWSNSGIEFCAKCDRITVFFGENPAEQPAIFKIYVDGIEVKASVAGKGTTAMIENLRDKMHKVKILRISEGSYCVSVLKAQIYGKAPEFSLPAEKMRLKLEFLGDSITAGFGVLADGEKMEYTTYEQDSTKTYAYLTAEALDAEIRTICISGEGICHSCGDMVGTPFIKFFNRTCRGVEGYTPDDFVPDIFIVNGGTNDKRTHVTSEEFIEGVITLLKDIRSKYPETPIIWMYGMMVHVFDEELKAAVNQFNKTDKNTHCLIVKSVNDYKNQRGTYGHPNVNASVRCAGILKRKILEVLSLNR